MILGLVSPLDAVTDGNRIVRETGKSDRHASTTEYHRAQVSGATWFFTVNFAERSGSRRLVDRIDALRAAFDYVRVRHPFRMAAVAILPDHLHCVWTLAPGDSEFLTRRG